MIPPMDTFGLGYTITLDNLSIGREQTINDISRIRIYTIPYQEMIQTKIQNTDKTSLVLAPATLTHPNSALYVVTIPKQVSETTLILNQSYDTGWIAFQNGKLLPNHALINNWANGWTIESTNLQINKSANNTTIIIFFWPQLLEWFGFLLIPLPFVLMMRKPL